MKIAQTTLLGILGAWTLIVLGLLGLIGLFTTRNTPRPLEYGSLFVVVLSILTALVGIFVAYPFLVRGVFDDPSQMFAFLAALFGALTGLVGTYFGIKSSSEARLAAERVTEAEERVEAAPEQAKPAWDLARATLDQYFQRNLGQIRAIFLLSVVVMLVGFLVICFGVLRAFQAPATLLPATIATLAGVITQFIGATFLFIYRSAIKQAIDYTKALERINSVGMAMQILDTMPTPHEPAAPDSLKDKTKAILAERLVQQAHEGSRGDQRDTSNA